MRKGRCLAAAITMALVACGSASPASEEAPMWFVLSSTAFANGQPIPQAHSCKGHDTSPPLAWSEPPSGTESFALIADDPDAPAGTWVHWVILNIPAATRGLTDGIPAQAQLFDGSVQGKNSSGRVGYQGPCPPSGTHRYFFRLYALDGLLGVSSGVDKRGLLSAMEGHVLGQAELMGTFSK